MLQKERDIAVAYRDGEKTNVICQNYSISISSLYRIVQKYNLPQRIKQTTKYVVEDEREIIKNYHDKMCIPEICHRHGINKTTLYAVLRRNNVQRRINSVPDALKTRIVEEYQRGMKVKCIADQCGFKTTKSVYAVLREQGVDLRIDPLTDDDRAYCIEQFKRGVCVSRLQRRSGTRLPYLTAKRLLMESGVSFEKRQKYNIDTDVARQRYEQGEMLSKIAADFCVSTQTLVNYMKRAGIDMIQLKASVAAKAQEKESQFLLKMPLDCSDEAA